MKQRKCLFREYYKKTIFSENKQYKARIYFEFDYERDGVYVDFSDKSNNYINRVQFTPSGYSIICQSVGGLEWIDNESVKVWNIQVPQIGTDADSNRKNYWIIRTSGEVEFRNIYADENDPHALYQLGLYYMEGTHILKNETKGRELIKKAADLRYKHATKWLEKNDSSDYNKNNKKYGKTIK